ncbi:cytochrome c oxidase subunit 3 [Cecembia lonarensis]|uniref:Cytochrome c oxidase subunit 3 n=1 Tax=Cecembia lonarensis (strain CCUG 58316 / KCTC 22772 / LW9) TaxID=1225176 RepID=K1M0D4_CECL9|nr:cytochrome c oxidase subunit 3 [Cecembia lonarensis]EKB49774.1 Cytochrome c oxidase subunit 3 [Cecembia lonarensis LW9]
MEKPKETWFQKIENMHPYQTLMYLGMFGSGLIFIFMTVAFLASATGNTEGLGFKMPKSFIISTFVILISGYTVSKMLLHYKEESLFKLKNSLLSTFFLGLIFTLLQFLGWKELTLIGVDFRGLPSGSFLYVLSGIHIFHLLGAMVFAIIMVVKYKRTEKDDIKHLVLLTNPYEKMKIQLFTTYWHFMDAIWLLLFMTFVLTF